MSRQAVQPVLKLAKLLLQLTRALRSQSTQRQNGHKILRRFILVIFVMLVHNLLVAVTNDLGIGWIAHYFASYHDLVYLLVNEELITVCLVI